MLTAAHINCTASGSLAEQEPQRTPPEHSRFPYAQAAWDNVEVAKNFTTLKVGIGICSKFLPSHEGQGAKVPQGLAHITLSQDVL